MGALVGYTPRQIEEMELWELAAATGNYLGPTPEEAKIEEMYARKDEIEAKMKERALRKRYDSQDMPVQVR